MVSKFYTGNMEMESCGLANAHHTLHDVTQQDNARQENRVMWRGLRQDATRQDKNRAL